MSVAINKSKCIGCGRCTEACPGNLLWIGGDKKAYIKDVRDCWGCTSCIKECPVSAINFFLGADIGGRGSVMTVRKDGQFNNWEIVKPDGEKKTIIVDSKSSNRY